MSLFRMAARIRAMLPALLVLIVQHVSAGTGDYHKSIPVHQGWNTNTVSLMVNGMYISMIASTLRSVAGYYYLDANPEYDHRDPLITLYQATQSITFSPGFETADGDVFTAEIVAYESQVPPPSNNTGNPNNNIHWIIAKSFDESGNVITESKQFFDNNGGLLQSQDKVKYRKDAFTAFTHVFASEPIRDVFGRIAATTMLAPIDNSEFSYKPDFLTNASSGSYDYTSFDRYGPANAETDKTNNPDPVGHNVQGTLGWYYSTNNTWEPYTPTTNYPYSRQVFYKDGTGNLKKTAGAGEPFKAGSGHEVASYTTPVINELSHYLQVRNRFFTSAELGDVPATLKNEAIQMIGKDPNGRMGIMIQGKEGNTLMRGRPGNDLVVNNTATVAPGNVFYFRTFASGNVTISSGTNEFYNMETEQPMNIGTGGSIASGYYKLVNTGASNIDITYSNSYTDVSYSFYNQIGKLVATIAPEGVKKLFGSDINNYVTKNDVPFITLYEYDVKGQLVKTTSTDGGTSEMVYRKDGKIRFSQNAEQKINSRYSYTNYDALGRAIESGEYQPDAGGIQC